jgi:hypothetical protein
MSNEIPWKPAILGVPRFRFGDILQKSTNPQYSCGFKPYCERHFRVAGILEIGGCGYFSFHWGVLFRMNADRHIGKGKSGPLTDTRIRTAKPKAKAYRIPDGKGLFLWVTPVGGKLWRWKYRHDGVECRPFIYQFQ